MIGPNSPLGTPGFFDQAVFPTGMGGLLPGTLPQDMPQIKVSPKMQEDYMKNVMAEFMASMAEVQASFAMFLGAPAPGTPGAQPKK
tara:strand:+ start:362 stop:619 length:258 start_codon:yes stop_codon:yes gene_type:complete